MHGELELPDGLVRVDWINQEGDTKQGAEWAHSRAFTKVITRVHKDESESKIAILINAHDHDAQMRLSRTGVKNDWRVVFCSAEEGIELDGGR